MDNLKKFRQKNKTVLLRVDYNVDFDKRGKVLDDFRIVKTLPTIKYLLSLKSKIILATHIGRPKFPVSDLSTIRLKPYLEKLLKRKIVFSKDFRLTDKETIKKLPNSIILLENLRFFKGEEKNDLNFTKSLAKLADVFVFDAFSVAHREHASVISLPKILKSYYGLLLEKEILNLKKVLNYKKRPLTLVLGGAKEKTKLPLINHWLNKADYILLGGIIGHDFLIAKGYDLGKSLFSLEFVKEAKNILKKPKKAEIILPEDLAILSSRRKKNSNIKNLGYKDNALDIGKETIKIFKNIIAKSSLIIYNGPMGYIEDKRFATGTKEIIKAIANSKAFSVTGGGETLLILKKSHLENKFSFVSTGGGAMLRFLSNKPLAIEKFIK